MEARRSDSTHTGVRRVGKGRVDALGAGATNAWTLWVHGRCETHGCRMHGRRMDAHRRSAMWAVAMWAVWLWCKL